MAENCVDPAAQSVNETMRMTPLASDAASYTSRIIFAAQIVLLAL